MKALALVLVYIRMPLQNKFGGRHLSHWLHLKANLCFCMIVFMCLNVIHFESRLKNIYSLFFIGNKWEWLCGIFPHVKIA